MVTVAGIVIPSDSPPFLAIVAAHVALWLVPVAIGAPLIVRALLRHPLARRPPV